MGDELDVSTLTRARRGDPAALAQLVRVYERPVFALVSRLLCGRSRAAVEDVAQEAFVRIIRNIDRFDPAGPARLSSWILTIATRVALTSLRGKRREEPLSLAADPVDSDDSPEQITMDRQLTAQVSHAMAALPEPMRAVLVLRAYHDLDYPEIAAALDVDVGTVKSRLARARAALRDALDRGAKEAAS
jgi:RNA polymerase sigma-70 factor (ECF subfamily)